MAKQKTPEERLNGFFLSQMVDLAGEPWPQGLFHYTTSAGMRAIISSGVLRAHNVEQMNDFTEGRYAASVMRAFIDRQYAIESNADATKLFEAMREQLSTVDLTDVFALSFTTDGDELGMWRLYADRGRGFSFSVSIRKALNWAGQMHQGAIMRCCYNAERLERFCCQALSKIRSIYLEDLAEGVALAPAGYSALFFELAVWCAPLFKSSAWRDEKEWRFVFMRPNAPLIGIT